LSYNPLMKTSRQRLLEYIQHHRAITTHELSQALHMTQANVRHHLGILMERGLVEVIGQHAAEGKGRPARFFGPSEKSLGNNLDILSNALLQQANLTLTPEAREVFIKCVADKMLIQISSESNLDMTLSLTQRLYRAIHVLNQFHYQARWEAHAEAPHLIVGHCPYLEIQAEHPELCQMDAYLLTKLLNAEAMQISRLARDRNGTSSCIFQVNKLSTG